MHSLSCIQAQPPISSRSRSKRREFRTFWAPSATITPNSPSFALLSSWITKHGGIVSKELLLEEQAPCGARGIVASPRGQGITREDLDQGPLITLPHALYFDTEKAVEIIAGALTTARSSFGSQPTYESSLQLVREELTSVQTVALGLALERQRGNDSPWHAYIDSLPTYPPCPWLLPHTCQVALAVADVLQGDKARTSGGELVTATAAAANLTAATETSGHGSIHLDPDTPTTATAGFRAAQVAGLSTREPQAHVAVHYEPPAAAAVAAGVVARNKLHSAAAVAATHPGPEALSEGGVDAQVTPPLAAGTGHMQQLQQEHSTGHLALQHCKHQLRRGQGHHPNQQVVHQQQPLQSQQQQSPPAAHPLQATWEAAVHAARLQLQACSQEALDVCGSQLGISLEEVQWALGQVISRSLSSGDASGLLPLIDLLNHHPEARPPMLQLDDSDQLVMTVTSLHGGEVVPLGPGQELYINYAGGGAVTPLESFLKFGFVPAEAWGLHAFHGVRPSLLAEE